MVVTRALTVWRADPGSQVGLAPDDTLPRLSAEDAARVADYLDAGAVVARTTARRSDPWSDSDTARVPLTQRTDGVWRWDDAVSYYVRRYGLSPGAEFMAYVRDRAFVPPIVSSAQVGAVIDEVFGAAGAVPTREILLDGSRLLPTDSFCSYRGQNFRYTFVGRGDDRRVRLSVRPGEPIPEGFEQSATPAQEIAYKPVDPAEIDTFSRVVSSCLYKGGWFSVVTIDGPVFGIHLGGGRQGGDAAADPVSPTFTEWGLLPNVEVLGQGDIWARVDVFEAARVTMAVIPHHLVSGRVVPVRDVTGHGYAVPTADEIFYFPSPADSPYLPPAEAAAVIRAHDPQYPFDEAAPQRLRDGWRLNPVERVSNIYHVADDGVVFVASADVAVEQADSRLSADFRSRHPVVDPPPAHDSGTEVFA